MVFPPPGIAIDELAGHRMRRRSATDRIRRPARSNRRQTNDSGALRRTPPPSPSPLDPPTPRHPPPLRNSQGGGGTLGGELRLGPALPRPTGSVPRPPARGPFCAGGNTSKPHLGGYAYVGKHGWRKQQRRAHQTCRASPPNPRGRNCHSLCNKTAKRTPVAPRKYIFYPSIQQQLQQQQRHQQHQHHTATPRYARARWVPSCPQCAKSPLASGPGRLSQSAANARRGMDRPASHARLIRLSDVLRQSR